jgi:hypothetical protein
MALFASFLLKIRPDRGASQKVILSEAKDLMNRGDSSRRSAVT